MNTTTKYIAYYRVSTRAQGDSGLGLEAQQQLITRDIGTPLMEFVEVASGTKQRDVLDQAIEACLVHGAILVVAKIDRLARNVQLACDLINRGVQIRVTGMPSMSTLTFHILCAVAEEEARLISQRTSAALAIAKSRGIKLGGYHPRKDGKPRALPTGKRVKVDRQLVAQCQQLRDRGLTWAEVAELINGQGYRAPKGGAYSPSQLHRLVTFTAAQAA
jgi:DNA invertase Pin-like site-specific DNA recombinase